MKTLVKWVVAVAVITVFLCCASALADNLSYTFDGDVMTISGTGDMDDYAEKPPWYDKCSSRTGYVHSVIISDGVTGIGSNAFFGCSSLTSITIPNSVTRVGAGAFTACDAIRYAGPDTAAAEALSKAGYSFRASGNNYNIRYLYTGDQRTGLSIDTVDKTVTSFIFPEGVKEIGNYAFSNCRNLTEITIPETVESIGTGAFQGCAGLTEIAIPEGVERIEVNTFSGCNNLAGITIPGSLKSVGTGAFTECWSMTNIHIASIQAWAGILFESKESFPTNYFTPSRNNPTRLYIGNEEVTQVEISGGITSIGNYAFYKCRNITSVTLPQGVTGIGHNAFEGCSGMTGITIREGLESIGEYAFNGCTSLTRISLPDGVTTIGSYAFSGCSSMTELSLPDDVTSIGSYAFSGCRSLTEITVPESLTTIADYTFQNCSGLTEITIPAGITRVGSCALNGCSSLGKVTFSGYSCTFGQNVFSDPAPSIYCISGSNADSWATGNGYQVFYLDNPQQEYIGTDGNIQWTLTQDGALTISGSGAMRNYGAQDYAPWGRAVTGVTIGEGVTSIGAYAFSGCSGLTEITIPENVKSIGNYAFTGCVSLAKVTIPGKTCTFGENVFSTPAPTIRCKTDSDAYTWATANNYTIEPLPVLSGTDGQLRWELYEGGALHISGTGDMNDYTECHAPWYGNAITSVEIGEGVTGIGEYAFTYCGLLESITIPNGVTRIGKCAFGACSKLASVTLPSSLQNVGFSAFWGCDAISEIHVPSLESWLSITYGEGQSRPHYETQAWRLYVNGEEPTGITIPASITAVPDYAFRRCTSLESVTIQDGVTSIGNVAFAYCPNLENVIIPDSVTTIGSSVFSGCADGMSVTIGKNVSEMGYELFGSVDNSSNVRIQTGLDTETARMLGKRGYAFRTPNQKYTLKYTFTGDTVSGLIVTGADQDITNAAIPDSVTGIAANAFANCESLTEITIPGSIKSIGNSAFSGSTNISTIHLSDIKSWLTIQYGNASSHPNNGSCHLYIGEREITAVTIPDSITTIEELAFSGCSGLTEITVPANVTLIRDGAMQGCTSLTQVTMLGNRCTFGSNIFTGTAPTIRCYKGSEADTWATEQEYPVEYLENALPVDSGDDGNIHWERFADGELRLSGTGAMKDYSFSNAPWSGEITKAVIGEGVTTIGNYAFYGRDKLESVTIPDSVTGIGDSAFEQCGSLKNVNLPQGVTSIGNFAFEYCTGLAGITIPDSVTELGTGAFKYTGLKSVTIPNSITSIPNTAFSGSALQSVVISEGITEIGDYAFLGCTDLMSITLPSGMQHIGISAFGGCGNAAEIHISSIGDWLNIRFESGNPFSGPYSLFVGNTKQTAVTIPQGVTSIRDYAFQNCSLTEITVPAGVTRIGSYALNGCASLEKITILGNSCSFGNDVVSTPLPTVYCYDGSDADGWAGRNGCTVVHLENPVPVDSGTDGNIQWERYANGELRISGSGKIPNYSLSSAAPWGTTITSVIIENGVTAIGDYAFYNCSRITDIALPESVKNIGYCAFKQCYGLKSIAIPGVNGISNYAFNSCTNLHEIHISSIEAWLRIAMSTEYTLPQSYSLYIDNVEQTTITIPEGVDSIWQYAFMNCTGMREIIIPEGVRLIGQYAFYGCSNLTEITLPYSAVSSGMHAFENCPSLEKVTVLNRNFEFGDSAFNRTPKPTIYCYADSKAAAWATRNSYPVEYLEDNTSITWEIEDGTLTISGTGDMQDYDYNRRAPWGTGFTRVVIEEGITGIGKYAFYHCADLEEITIPSTVVRSGAYAFDECRKMKTIHISDIASWISLQIPEFSPKYAAPNDFSSECHLYIGNTKVTEVTIPAGTTSLREGLFRACVDLTSVTLPASVKEIGESAFRGCSNLQNINIPAGVESIDPFVFAGCSSLQEITLPDSVKVLQGYAFAYCTSLEDVELPERGLAFASAVFEGCTALQSITIPDGTTSIMSYLFQDCSNLRNVTIPDSVKYIREGVFQNCTSLKTILIPDSVIDLGQNLFEGCSGLTIRVYHHTSYAAGWAAENNYPYEAVHQNLIYQAPVEATCTDAGTGACWVCSLCGRIFADAEGTEEIEAAEEIPAFNHAWSETTYVWNADHTQVTASRSCANNAAHNQSETVNATYRVEPPTENQAGALYITAAFTNEAFRLPEVTVIPALKDMNVLRLPAQLATIEAGAFAGTDCEAVIIPDGCEAIGAGAFANCRELVYVLISASVTDCAGDAFDGCPKAVLDFRQATE